MLMDILFVNTETQLTLWMHIYKNLFRVPHLMVSRKNSPVRSVYHILHVGLQPIMK